MTREEAKEYIDYYYCHTTLLDEYGDYCDQTEYEIAFEIALKALEQEPCGDAISRQAVDDVIYDYSRSCNVDYSQIMEFIEKIPSIIPQQRTGRWIDDTSLGYHVSICSNCDWRGHGDTCLIYRPKYCPNCGAKMEVEE